MIKKIIPTTLIKTSIILIINKLERVLLFNKIINISL